MIVCRHMYPGHSKGGGGGGLRAEKQRAKALSSLPHVSS